MPNTPFLEITEEIKTFKFTPFFTKIEAFQGKLATGQAQRIGSTVY